MRKSKPHLILPSGEIFILKGNTSIGRAENCSIRLEGPKVSREHTHFYEIGGKYQVVDSESRNGTYLNEVRLRRPTTLKTGDRVSVGGHVLTFFDDAAVPVTRETVAPLDVTIASLVQVPGWLLLADIKGSTTLTQSMGVEDYSALVGDWFHRCRKIIEQGGGEVNQSTGDGLLAFWKDPDNQAAERVATSLIELKKVQQEARPPFRVIVHCGSVGLGRGGGVGEEPLTGQDVHYIFRMEKALGGTEHMLGGTQPAAHSLQPWIRHEEIGKFPLKGFEGDHSLFTLIPAEPGSPAQSL